MLFSSHDLGSIDLYNLYDSESTRLQVTGHSGEVIIYNCLFLLATALPLEVIKLQGGF